MNRDRFYQRLFSLVLAVLMVSGTTHVLAASADDPGQASGLANEVVQSEGSRRLSKRTPKPWKQIAQERKMRFSQQPESLEFARPLMVMPAMPQVSDITSANEADPVEAVLTEWWCSSHGIADEFDMMWMSIIGESVRAGTTAYVYLYSYLGDDDATTLANCSAMLEAYQGVSPTDVHWIQDYATDAFWIRDFGPLFVRDRLTMDLSIEDPLYYPGRPNDDAQPVEFAARIGVPVSDFNIYFEGGNFLPNGGGLCITSSIVLDYNPHYSEKEIRYLFHQELGCDELVIVQALDDQATGHVDMWLAWADHETLIVGEYSWLQDRTNRAIIEENVQKKLTGLVDPEAGNPIKIIRMPMPSNCPPDYYNTFKSNASAAPSCPGLPSQFRSWRTYLNVMLINGSVLMPVYAQDRTYEDEASEIWESLGFEVVPVKADAITPLAGQIHCIMKTIDAAVY